MKPSNNAAAESPFVVLRHTFTDRPADSHFDLMLCDREGLVVPAGMLITWRIEEWPPRANERARLLAPHRSDYLYYEGPVSRNRGSVARVDTGVWRGEHVSLDEFRLHLKSKLRGVLPLCLLRQGDGSVYSVILEEKDVVRNKGPTGR